MFRRIWQALDRLEQSILNLADRFDSAAREIDERKQQHEKHELNGEGEPTKRKAVKS